MKKKHIATIIFAFYTMLCVAQQHDNIWLFGYGSNADSPHLGGSIIDFSSGQADFYFQEFPMNLDHTNASICNEDGDLLFYTNGVEIHNAAHEQMENGDDLNPGGILGWGSEGLIIPQGAIALPYPEKENEFILFHTGIKIVDMPNGPIRLGSAPLYYSIIDMSENNGLGEVEDKNVVIANDTLDGGKIIATKHGNGRDWWVISSKFLTNKFVRILSTPDAVINYGDGIVSDTIWEGLGQAVFSPDGNYIAHLSLINTSESHLTFYSFDRCSGEITQLSRFSYAGNLGSGGVAFSPNSQYLYLSSSTFIMQFDVEAPDIIASIDTVAVYDGYLEPLYSDTDTFNIATRFFLAQLAPDNKIYIAAPNAVKSLHVINQPDLGGEACEVLQHHVQLSTLNKFSMPNFPNYRLGKLVDSPCDTLDFNDTTDEVMQQVEIQIYPNPTNDEITLQSSQVLKEDGEWILYNQLGQTVAQRKLKSEQKLYQVNLASIPKGMYVYSVFQNGRLLNSGKLVIE